MVVPTSNSEEQSRPVDRLETDAEQHQVAMETSLLAQSIHELYERFTPR